MASTNLTAALAAAIRCALVVLAMLAVAACAEAGQVTAGADPEIENDGGAGTEDSAAEGAGIPVPDDARSAHTGTEFCGTNTENTRIEMAFNGTVRAIEMVEPTTRGEDPDTDYDADADADPRPLPWVTFDVDAWYTEDLGTEIALWGRNFEGKPGERWLIAASRYTVGQHPSGDIYWCASEPESIAGLAAWDDEYGGTVAPGEDRPENPPPPDLIAEIETARTTWLAEAPPNYTAFVVNHTDSSEPRDPDDSCPNDRARIVVEDGVVVQALNVSDNCELDPTSAPTIGDLFETAIAAAGAVDYNIEFDPDHGFVDSLGAFDRSISVSAGVNQFIPEARPMISSADTQAFVAELDQARTRWRNSGITDYTVTVDNLCFCGFGGPAKVVVVDGEMVDVQPEDPNAAKVVTDQGFVLTVDDAFNRIEDSLDADRMHVSYHSELGYPVEIDIDYITDAVDDELQVLILAFDARR